MLTSSVVIATCARARPLRECLQSLAVQTVPPLEIIIVDASTDDSTWQVCEQEQGALQGRIHYHRAMRMGASPQRNQGSGEARGDLLVFVDDDAILEPSFLAELREVFDRDPSATIGGVGATIVNQNFTSLSLLNRMVFLLCTGVWPRNLAGRVVGPGINFLPSDRLDTVVQQVDWLNTTGTAYRHDVFRKYGFDENVLYPLEDLHLSMRIGRDYRLMNSTKARLFHNDMGRRSKRDWSRIGEGMILSRHSVATHVLNRTGLRLYLPLFGYELLYSTLAMLWNGGKRPDYRQAFLTLKGKLRGAGRILTGRTLPRPDSARAGL